MKCLNCNKEFEGRKDAKFCSSKCRVTFNRLSVTKGLDVTDNVTDNEVFKFTVTYNKKPGDNGYDDSTAQARRKVRTAVYWYDVPLGAVPLIQKDWPSMPDHMNGRQYFLWWKNEFEIGDNGAILHNPLPSTEGARLELAGPEARRWGA